MKKSLALGVLGIMEIETAIGLVRVNLNDYVFPASDGRCDFIDGDTIVVGGQHWRLQGFDAPAMGGKAHGDPHCEVEEQLGRKARDSLIKIVADGAQRRALHAEILGRDRHQRYVVRIKVDGRDVSKMLIEQGLAVEYYGHGPKPPFCSCPARLARYDLEVWEAAQKHR